MNIHIISSCQMIRDISTLYLARIDDVHLQTYRSIAEFLQMQCCVHKGQYEADAARSSQLHNQENQDRVVKNNQVHSSRYETLGALAPSSSQIQDAHAVNHTATTSSDDHIQLISDGLANASDVLRSSEDGSGASALLEGYDDLLSNKSVHQLNNFSEEILLVDIPAARRLDLVFQYMNPEKQVAVCVMDARVHTAELEELLTYPISALLQLDEVGRNLYDILCEVRAGKTVLTRSAALKFIESHRFSVSKAKIVDDSLSQQTSQEFERALDLFVVFGFSRSDIAHNLCITTHAVSSRIRSGYIKYSVNDRKQAFDCLIGPHALGSVL